METETAEVSEEHAQHYKPSSAFKDAKILARYVYNQHAVSYLM